MPEFAPPFIAMVVLPHRLQRAPRRLGTLIPRRAPEKHPVRGVVVDVRDQRPRQDPCRVLEPVVVAAGPPQRLHARGGGGGGTGGDGGAGGPPGGARAPDEVVAVGDGNHAGPRVEGHVAVRPVGAVLLLLLLLRGRGGGPAATPPRGAERGHAREEATGSSGILLFLVGLAQDAAQRWNGRESGSGHGVGVPIIAVVAALGRGVTQLIILYTLRGLSEGRRPLPVTAAACLFQTVDRPGKIAGVRELEGVLRHGALTNTFLAMSRDIS
mmetsp:Transcript_5407/g.11373  ORF Transcript_5407/g.11373 Transcript_5407/m.11373 type:complete len:269 (+) Transcript_5407:662-1468(+)